MLQLPHVTINHIQSEINKNQIFKPPQMQKIFLFYLPCLRIKKIIMQDQLFFFLFFRVICQLSYMEKRKEMMKSYPQSQQGCFSSFSLGAEPHHQSAGFSPFIQWTHILHKSGFSPNSEPLPYPGERSHTPVIPTPPPLLLFFFFFTLCLESFWKSAAAIAGGCAFMNFSAHCRQARRSLLVSGEMEAVFSNLSMSRDHTEYNDYSPPKVHCQSISISTKMLTDQTLSQPSFYTFCSCCRNQQKNPNS